MRVIFAIVAGFSVWSALWLAGNTGIKSHEPWSFTEGEPYTERAPLLAALGLSVVCSLIGGACAAAIARELRRAALILLSLALVSVGAAIQAQVWQLMPLWYHLMFLLLLPPATLLGGRLIRESQPLPEPAGPPRSP
ncbi:MAG: hypothetical protein DRQ55_04270 [Planctomycetota bacterium]|nr:MAG: hypothetical protein DRQ55_04270 [Planctomycetota bacterium]